MSKSLCSIRNREKENREEGPAVGEREEKKNGAAAAAAAAVVVVVVVVVVVMAMTRIQTLWPGTTRGESKHEEKKEKKRKTNPECISFKLFAL